MAAFFAIVQTLSTQWTKASRGAPASRRRNATPTAFKLPDAFPPQISPTEVIWHDVGFGEPKFAPISRVRTLPLGLVRVDGLDLVLVEPSSGIRVDVFGKRQFTVLPGELGEVTFNWAEDRIEDAWRISVYHKVVARIARDIVWPGAEFYRQPTHTAAWRRTLR